MVSDHIEAIKSGTTGEEPCGGRPRRPMRAMLERMLSTEVGKSGGRKKPIDGQAEAN